MPRRALLVAALAALAAPLLSGCDTVAELVGVDAFDVPLGSAAIFPLLPFATGSGSTDVDVEHDLPDVFDVERISIPQSGVIYTPATGARSGGAPCEVHLYVVIDGAPALQSTITLDEGASPAVQSVTSDYAQPYDRDAICEGLAEDCPVTDDGLTEAQIRDRVDEAVAGGRFALDLVAANDGPCDGLLQVETLHFELDF